MRCPLHRSHVSLCDRALHLVQAMVLLWCCRTLGLIVDLQDEFEDGDDDEA